MCELPWAVLTCGTSYSMATLKKRCPCAHPILSAMMLLHGKIIPSQLNAQHFT